MFFANSSLFYSQIAPILLKSMWLTLGSVETRFGPHPYSLKDCTLYVVT